MMAKFNQHVPQARKQYRPPAQALTQCSQSDTLPTPAQALRKHFSLLETPMKWAFFKRKRLRGKHCLRGKGISSASAQAPLGGS